VPTDRVDIEMARKYQERVPTFFITGLHAVHDRRFQREFQRISPPYELVATFPYRPSTLVLLDHYDPRETDFRAVSAEVRVFRVSQR
jgi:hypothetical protein